MKYAIKNGLKFGVLTATSLLLGAATSAQAEPESVAIDDGPPPAFDKLDIDGDHQISRQEAKLERKLFLHFDAFDTDRTNHLSAREYEKYKDY